MLFGLHVDAASQVSLWIAPDDQRVVPRIRLTVDDTTTVVAADVSYPDVKAWGWHSTGLCGFAISEATVAGLGQAGTVEIRDYETNLLLYRRSDRLGATARRVLFLDHTAAPSAPLRDLLYPHFQVSHLTLRTANPAFLNAMFNNPSYQSQLYCGPVFYPLYESHLNEHNFLKLFLAHDPYVELARRILWLRRASERAVSTTSHWQIEELLEACYFASSLNLDKPLLLRKAFKTIDAGAAKVLSNPMTRCLGARDDREALSPGHWSAAIQNLSRFDIVGHDDYAEEFTTSALQALGLPAQPAPRATVPAAVRDLADLLRSLKSVIPLVEMDLDLSDRIRSLVEKFWK